MALRSSALSIAIFLLSTVFAQDCFYPNGSLSTGDSRESPCGGSTSICCPLNWECMSNGLCYYPPDDFYGRYSCTDETWGACPDICTYDYNAYGGEAILQCSNGKYCCDKDRSFDCCTVDDTDYFPLPAGKSIASISALAEVTTPASTVHNAQSTTTDDNDSSTSALSSIPTSSSAQVAPATVTHESATTGKDGSVSTVTKVITSTPSAIGAGSNQSATSSDSSSNLGFIVGLAVGIPVFLIIAAIIACLLWRRRRKNKHANINSRPSSPPMMANYSNIPPGTHASEIAGYPIADTKNKKNRRSELSGNDTYIYSPNPSTHANKSSPPNYSPGSKNQNSPQAKSPGMSQIPEEAPAELWGGYVPYRPPNAQQAPVSEGEAASESPTAPPRGLHVRNA